MAKPLTPLEQKQLSAFLEIIPNKEVHLVQEALDTGYYRGVSLYDAQRALLSHENFSEFGEEFATHGSYNRQVFESFLDRIRTDPRGLYDRIKRAVWSNDLDILDPSKPTQATISATKGELIPVRPIADQPPPPKPGEPPKSPPSDDTENKKPETPPEEEEETEDSSARPERSELPEQTQQRLDQANRSMQRSQRNLAGGRQNSGQQPQSSDRMQQRLSAANRRMRSARESTVPGERIRAGRSATINPNRPRTINRRRLLPLRPKTTPPVSGGLMDALSNYWLARDALSAARWLADKLGFNRLGNLLGRLNNVLGLPERFLGNLLKDLGGWAGPGIRSLIGNGLNLARSGLGNFMSAARAYGGQAAAAGAGIGAGIYYTGTVIAALLVSAAFWWIVAILALFVFTFWYSNMLSNSQCEKPGQMEVKKVLENSLSGVNTAVNGEQLDYQIQITYIWLCDATTLPSVTITDTVPTTLEYVEGSATSGSFAYGSGPQGVYNEATRTITWNLTNISSNDPYGVFFSVKPFEKDDGTWSVQDTWLQNQASVTYTEPVAARRNPLAPVSGNIPPTADNCNGKYPLKNPIGNFGDPTCTFTKDDLYTMLLQNDPVNANYWFDVVIKCESSYDPSAHADHGVVGTPDAEGAWGLYQMGRGKNGQYDHGDVIWQLQTSNAITYNNNLARKWRYWACARDRW